MPMLDMIMLGFLAVVAFMGVVWVYMESRSDDEKQGSVSRETITLSIGGEVTRARELNPIKSPKLFRVYQLFLRYKIKLTLYMKSTSISK